MEIVFLVVAAALVLVCGLFVLAEFALVTVNRSKVEVLADKGDASAKLVVEALSSLSTQLSSAQVGITITNLAIGFLAEPAVASFIKYPLLAVGIDQASVPMIAIVVSVALATVVTMIFGELVPKNIAIAEPLKSAKFIAKYLLTFTRILHVPLVAINNSANSILGLFGIKAQEELASARSADELLSLVKRSADKGTLTEATAELLEKSLTFGDQTAVDVMTPRVQVEAVPQSMSVATLIEQARQTNTSRFPVYDKSIDDVTGVVHIKNLLSIPKHKRTSTRVGSVMLKPVFVPASLELELLLAAMKSSKLQLVVVIDEFGGMDGIITLEDILEELVGEVQDEHDPVERYVITERSGRYRVSGRLRPDEIADELGLYLPDEEEFETLAGLFIHEYEKIPHPGDKVIVLAVDQDGNQLQIELTVRQMDGNRIDWLGLKVLRDSNTSSTVGKS